VPDRVRGWNDQANEYVEERREAGEWAETTVATYRGVLRVLQNHLMIPGREPPTPATVVAEHIRHFRESGLAPNTVGLQLVILRGFLRWVRNPVAGEDRLFRVKRNDLGKRRWLSPEQSASLWNAATPEERVPIGLMLFAGLRRIEVLRLRVRDIDFDLSAPTARVCGKGQKWRSVDLPPVVWATLRSWTAERRLGPNDRVWPGTKNAVDRALYNAGRRCGAFGIRPKGTPDVSCHDLRRTFIRAMLATGKVDLWDVAPMVGHSSVEMTAHYAGLNRTKAAGALRAMESALGIAPPS
jgi:integrase/recombinase XerD